jgi:hypothetical protein
MHPPSPPLRIHRIPHIATTSKSQTTVVTGKINAAVLVQQVRDVDGMPGVLLELRGDKLRSHAGEVRKLEYTLTWKRQTIRPRPQCADIKSGSF